MSRWYLVKPDYVNKDYVKLQTVSNPVNTSLVVKVNNDHHETGDGFSGSSNITNE